MNIDLDTWEKEAKEVLEEFDFNHEFDQPKYSSRILALIEALKSQININLEFAEQAIELKEELAEKTEALEFYANYLNHTKQADKAGYHYVPTIRDCGQKARDVLEKWSKK